MGNARQFARALAHWATVEMPADYKDAGTVVAMTALQTAHRHAAVDTGAMKAHIAPWAGSPGLLPFNPGHTDRRPGFPVGGTAFTGAVQVLQRRRPFERFGIASAAPYSSYVNDGTPRMAAQPFFDAAREAADRVVVRQQRRGTR